MYDFDKLALFCILYSDENHNKKANLLYDLMIGPDNVIQQRGSKVKHIFSYLTVIACVITAEFIHSVSFLSTLILIWMQFLAPMYKIIFSLNVRFQFRCWKRNFNHSKRKVNLLSSISSIRQILQLLIASRLFLRCQNYSLKVARIKPSTSKASWVWSDSLITCSWTVKP